MSDLIARWDRFWGGLPAAATPPWGVDPAHQTSMSLNAFRPYMTAGLPLVDVACGDGQQTAWLSDQLPTPVVGVDASAQALERARTFNGGHGVMWRRCDILDDDQVAVLSEDVGPANVACRFLLHHLGDAEDRVRAVANLATLTGRRGRMFNLELVDPDPRALEGYAARPETQLRRLLDLGVTPGQLWAGQLKDLHMQQGLSVLAGGRRMFEVAHPEPDGSPAAFPVEWIISGYQ